MRGLGRRRRRRRAVPGPRPTRTRRDAGSAQGTFTSTAATAVSVVDILRAETPALRLTQDFHPSPTTPNLYEITATLENISGGPLTDVRYERVMDWDVEPTAEDEFVTINRGPSPPRASSTRTTTASAQLPVLGRSTAPRRTARSTPATVNADYVDSGPGDHGARFRFGFGDLAAGESKEFFLYYGAAGDEADANAAVSAAALEVFSYGQPNTEGGATLGTPNTFIWGFRGVGGTAAIPPTLSLTPESASSDVGGSHSLTATLTGSGGAPVPGAKIVFGVAGANAAAGTGTTDGNGQAGFNYAGTNAGDDTITACLDADNSGGCDAGEVTDTATKHWNAPPPPPSSHLRRRRPRRRWSARRSWSTWCPARSRSRARTASSARSRPTSRSRSAARSTRRRARSG